MRIAQISPAWLPVPPDGYGGIELIIAALTDELTARGHQVRLIGTGDCVTDAELRWHFDTAPGLPGPRALQALENDTRQAAFMLAEVADCDIVHVHSPYAGLLAGALTGLPLVHTDHGWHSSHPLFRVIGDRVDIVAPSHAYLRELPPLPHRHVVHHGIDTGRYPYRAEKQDYLAFIGRMVEVKGLHLAIRTARAAGLRLRAVAVGLGFPEEARYYQEQIEPLLDDDIELLRHEVGFPAKAELLAGARALLFPINWREPFGLVVPEAQACGTPVIAASCAAVPELICPGRTGFAVPHGEFVERAAELLRSGLPGVSPLACRRWAEQRFGLAGMVDGYERIYREIVARRRQYPDG